MFPNEFGILYYYFIPIFILIIAVIFLIFFNNKKEMQKLTILPAFNSSFIKQTILIVDNSPEVRLELLNLLGHTYFIVTASNVQEALELIKIKKISLLLTYFETSITDEFNFISSFMKDINRENVPIIVISPHEEVLAKLHQITNIDVIFSKPWDEKNLLKKVFALSRTNY